MSTSPPLQIGPYHVLGFHGLTDAPAVHATLAQQHIDAAVVNHEYIVSLLHLAAALHRAESGAVTPGTIATSARRTPQDHQRHDQVLYVALAPTRHLDRVLQALRPTADTSALVVLWRAAGGAGAADTAAAVRQAAVEKGGGAEHPLAPAAATAAGSLTAAERLQPFAAYVAVEKVLAFYGIARAEYDAWCTVAAAADAAAVAASPDLLPMLELEQSVLNRLAVSDC